MSPLTGRLVGTDVLVATGSDAESCKGLSGIWLCLGVRTYLHRAAHSFLLPRSGRTGLAFPGAVTLAADRVIRCPLSRRTCGTYLHGKIGWHLSDVQLPHCSTGTRPVLLSSPPPSSACCIVGSPHCRSTRVDIWLCNWMLIRTVLSANTPRRAAIRHLHLAPCPCSSSHAHLIRDLGGGEQASPLNERFQEPDAQK
ncbi:hypothetical protein LZ30DRAFT_397538 [Colletotrichum cereale]|nr:hypothetical protein LZ30DRAFT_397538 [Colletotrichum cereale]